MGRKGIQVHAQHTLLVFGIECIGAFDLKLGTYEFGAIIDSPFLCAE